jgi:PAS domain S-box-containing protein
MTVSPVRTVLVLAHDSDRAQSLSLLLRQSGFATSLAVDEADGFEKAHESRPDAIVCDVIMPRMDGFRLWRAVRADEHLRDTPVVLVTAPGKDGDSMFEGMSAGADDLLEIPYDPMGLVVKLTRLIERRHVEVDAGRRLRALCGALADLVIVLDREGRVHDVEQTKAGVLYRPAAEMMGRSLHDLMPEHADRFVSEVRRALAAGEPHDVEYSLDIEGALKWFEATISPLPDDTVFWVARDVTDSRALHDKLATERWMSQMLEAASDAFVVLDGDWRVRYVNPSAERMARRAREEMIGQVLWDMFPEARGSAFERNYTLAVRSGEPVTFEAEYSPLGVWLAVRASPIAGGLALVLRDITDERQQRERLREQAALLDAAQDAIFLRDLDRRIRYWNRSAERLYGWGAPEVLGKAVEDLIYVDPQQFAETWRIAVEQGSWSGELRHKSRAGREFVVQSRWTLIRSDDGAPQSILSINTDVTERKALESQFLRAQRMESIGTLAGGIAHDLNNVLTPVTMAIDLLRSEVESAQGSELLDTLGASVRRGADLVKQVLTFARGVDGRRSAVDPRQLLSEIQKIIADTFPRSIEVRVQVQADAAMINADSTQVHQVLLNLALNARDAMPLGGKLSLAATNVFIDEQYTAVHPGSRSGHFVAFDVSDTGIGMAPDVMRQIFDPFFTTKEVGGGTGLGLSTSLAIVESHGGFINVYSEPLRGSTFKVYLPVAGSSEMSAAPSDSEPVPRGRGELILLVDDEPAVRAVTTRTLEAFGYRVLTAEDGAEAIAVFVQHRHEIAAVITDLMMPVMDGAATIHALRRVDPTVKIIAASGLAANESSTQLRGQGVNHFLAKPYSAPSMLRVLDYLLRGDASSRASPPTEDEE